MCSFLERQRIRCFLYFYINTIRKTTTPTIPISNIAKDLVPCQVSTLTMTCHTKRDGQLKTSSVPRSLGWVHNGPFFGYPEGLINIIHISETSRTHYVGKGDHVIINNIYLNGQDIWEICQIHKGSSFYPELWRRKNKTNLFFTIYYPM